MMNLRDALNEFIAELDKRIRPGNPAYSEYLRLKSEIAKGKISASTLRTYVEKIMRKSTRKTMDCAPRTGDSFCRVERE